MHGTMNAHPFTLFCPACGQGYDPGQGHFSCPRLGESGEHVLDPVPGPGDPSGVRARLLDGFEAATDSFLACEPLLVSAALFGECEFREFAALFGQRLERFEGRRVHVTPLRSQPALAAELGLAGPLAVKDETGQPGGSHKIRHLAGTLAYLEALRRKNGAPKRRLAISSCGNAALAAASVARAAGYALRAFVPEDVDNTVEALLLERRAVVEVVPRLGVGQGDPPYLAFRQAVAQGAAPFSCSGRDNWSHLDLGQGLGVETALQWRLDPDLPGDAPKHLVVQVGGGALARSVATGFRRLRELGLVTRLPRLHVCQTAGLFVLVRTWLAVLGVVLKALGQRLPLAYDRSLPPARALAKLAADYEAAFPAVLELTDHAAARFHEPVVQNALALVAARGPDFAWPWDGAAPHSLAHGILDDETYDWYFLVREMLATGGVAAIVSEEEVASAKRLARAHAPTDAAAGISATGASGLAGLARLSHLKAVAATDSVGLFFTGRAH